MKFQNDVLLFYLPSFMATPLFIFFMGMALGVFLFLVYTSIFGKHHATSENLASYTSKLDSLSNMSPHQIISRARSVLEFVRSLNKINEYILLHKPVSNDSVKSIQHSVSQGQKILMNDNIDFYEFIGNWSKLRSNLQSVVHKIDISSKSKAITSEEFRKDVLAELFKLKETIDRHVE